MDIPLTENELQLLEEGRAELYRGRLIPIMRGGDGEDDGADVGDAGADAGADADAGDTGDAGDAGADAQADAGADAQAGAEASTIAELQEQIRLMGTQQQQLMDLLAEPEEDDDLDEGDLPEWDPLDPDMTQRYLDARDERLVGQLIQQLGPVLGFVQAQQAQAGDEQVAEAIAKIAPDLGSEPIGENLPSPQALAQSLANEAFMRAGGVQGRADPQAALRQGVQTVQALMKAAGTSAVEAYKEQLRTVAEAREEPGAGGGGTTIADAPADEFAAAARFVERATSG